MAHETRIWLLKNVPLDPRYEHTIGWASYMAQWDYFEDMAAPENFGLKFDNAMWVRKNQKIKVPILCDTILTGYNYCVVLNQWRHEFYFITEKKYISDSVTELTVELDVMQTYQFIWNIPACFVEREHVSDDLPGQHRLLEGLDVGEYVHTGLEEITALEPLAIVIQSSVSLTAETLGSPLLGSMQTGIFSGYGLYACTAEAQGLTNLTDTISKLSEMGKADAIAAMWMFPKGFIEADWEKEATGSLLWIQQTLSYDFEMTVANNLDGYVPRNKKLLGYPYSFIYIHNNMGGSAIYQYELFHDRRPIFRIGCNCGNDANLRLVPHNYRNAYYDNESGLTLGGYPSCAWTQDAYKIWLAQNQASQDLAIFGGNVQVALGAATAAAGALATAADLINPLEGDGGASGGRMVHQGLTQAYSGYMQVQGVLAARQDASVQPPQARGQQSSSTNIKLGMHTFTRTQKTITAEYAKIIDTYFDMYGYKVNTVKVPNLSGRTYWNYVKTIGCVVLGDFDANDRRKIAEILDKGITFWHSAAHMYRYDLAADNIEGVG